MKEQWCIAPKNQAEFVCRMEDILEVYQRPREAKRPLVCLDETTKQLTRETRRPLPLRPGRARRFDYEYERSGVATLFMLCAPLEGWRHVGVGESKTRVDYAYYLRDLAEKHFPEAEKIILVQDNLNTHDPASLYHAFEPQKARELIERFEFHYTPKHASWLNIAECELSALSRQCLRQRIAERKELLSQVRAWQNRRNRATVKVNWRFTTKDARIKLKKLYPSIQP